MARLDQICRHPIKSLGEEVIDRVRLTRGAHMPGDRVWAIAHGKSAFDPAAPGWAQSRNFVIQTLHPKLAQLTVALEEEAPEAATVTLTHPDLGAIKVRPEQDAAALTAWLTPIVDPRPAPPPYRVARAPLPMTDFEDSHISIGSLASLRALEEMAGGPLARIRFRMNLWLDGLEPWAEQDWQGREIAVGGARLRITAPAKRCDALNANPNTGARDTDLPRLLHGAFRHMHFGVYAQVTESGDIAAGDDVWTPS